MVFDVSERDDIDDKALEIIGEAGVQWKELHLSGLNITQKVKSVPHRRRTSSRNQETVVIRKQEVRSQQAVVRSGQAAVKMRRQ
jgi:hypothetical protein